MFASTAATTHTPPTPAIVLNQPVPEGETNVGAQFIAPAGLAPAGPVPIQSRPLPELY